MTFFSVLLRGYGSFYLLIGPFGLGVIGNGVGAVDSGVVLARLLLFSHACPRNNNFIVSGGMGIPGLNPFTFVSKPVLSVAKLVFSQLIEVTDGLLRIN